MGKNAAPAAVKLGNGHPKWAFSEAASFFANNSDSAKKYLDRSTKKHGKSKAFSILAHKLGRAVYFMLKNKEAFNQNKLLNLWLWRERISQSKYWGIYGYEHIFASRKNFASMNAYSMMIWRINPALRRFDWRSVPLLQFSITRSLACWKGSAPQPNLWLTGDDSQTPFFD